MRLLAGVLHSDEIVWNSYTWDADAHKQINTNQKNTAKEVRALNSVEYTSGTILNMALNLKQLPGCFIKTGNAVINDSPLNDKSCEFACIIYGHGARKVVLFTSYGTNITYFRSIFTNNWYDGEWTKI